MSSCPLLHSIFITPSILAVPKDIDFGGDKVCLALFLAIRTISSEINFPNSASHYSESNHIVMCVRDGETFGPLGNSLKK